MTEIYPLNKKLTKVDLVGFEPFKDVDSSSVAKSPYPYFYIYSNEENLKTISFNISPPKCLDSQDISIKVIPDLDLFNGIIENSGEKFEVEVDMRNSRVKRLQFISDNSSCIISASKLYFFELKDLSLE